MSFERHSCLRIARAGVFALVSVGLVSAPGSARADTGTVVVRRGDALSLLALRFSVTVDELRRWNHLASDRILEGQELRLAPEDDAEPQAIDATHAATPDAEPTAEAPAPSEPEPQPAAAPATPPARARHVDTLTYRVRRGDTLSGIAVSQGTTLAALRRLNEGLRPDRIREGQTLNIPAPDAPLRDHVVRRGESLGSIARRFHVRPREIRRWNAHLRRGHLQRGQHLRIYSEVRESRSESIGKPSRGTLAHAERLRPNPGYAIRELSRAYATLETTVWLSEGVDAVTEQFPGGPRIAVHDLSKRRGGRLRGHRSHQSGRDVDLSYYQRRCGSRPCPFRRLNPEQLDLRRQWALLHHWLERDELEYVFMDYGLSRALYRYARRHGATRNQLSRWFQYPRGRRHRLGIIRHYRGHRDHLHVRFVCPDTDEDCH
ncbi:MAG: LysM peptidoglycan-binding domain-containing protein [Deltaproteobacteria bacterium]|nr:LysM peptidoglycan-binding domain-containing protein [Deltaproteobacteria bacterium]